MSEVRVNWLLEIIWFTSKGINLVLWLAFVIIIVYYSVKTLSNLFEPKIKEKRKLE